MGNIAWQMSSKTALEFYRQCIAENVLPDSPEGTAILTELARDGKMQSVTTTRKTKEDFIKDKARHFKVLKIGKTNES